MAFLALNAQSIFPHAGNQEFTCYGVKVEESETAGSCRELNPEQPLVARDRGVLGSTPGSRRPFTSLYFHFITSKILYFQREARCSEHLYAMCMQGCVHVSMSCDGITMINFLTTVGYIYWKFLLGYGCLPWSVFSLLLGDSTGNL